MKGIPIPDLEPGSPEWLTVMSASKVSAMLGLSPWESPFSLWQRMAGRIPPEPDNDTLRRGHYLEPAIAYWFADQHPEVSVEDAYSYRHPERAWQTASPDRLITVRQHPYEPVALLEIKTANNDWEWGPTGTDQIPIGYRCQVQWQLDTLGLDRAHVAVLTPYMEFREYVIDYDPGDAAFLREQAATFMASLDTGTPPDIDDTDHTYQALRQLAPGITDDEVELDPALADDYLQALVAAKTAETAKTYATSRVAQAMGTARRAHLGNLTYATRQSRKTKDGTPGIPYLVAGRGLTQKESAAA